MWLIGVECGSPIMFPELSIYCIIFIAFNFNFISIFNFSLYYFISLYTTKSICHFALYLVLLTFAVIVIIGQEVMIGQPEFELKGQNRS